VCSSFAAFFRAFLLKCSFLRGGCTEVCGAESRCWSWQSSAIRDRSWSPWPRVTPASKAASCGKGDGRMWAAFFVFPANRAQRFILIIVFLRPAIAFLHALQFSRKGLVKAHWPKHICQRARSACLPESRISEQVLWGLVWTFPDFRCSETGDRKEASPFLYAAAFFFLMGKKALPLTQTHELSLLWRFTGPWHSVTWQKHPLGSIPGMDAPGAWAEIRLCPSTRLCARSWRDWGVTKPSAAAFLTGGMWPWPSKQSLHKRESNL